LPSTLASAGKFWRVPRGRGAMWGAVAWISNPGISSLPIWTSGVHICPLSGTNGGGAVRGAVTRSVGGSVVRSFGRPVSRFFCWRARLIAVARLQETEDDGAERGPGEDWPGADGPPPVSRRGLPSPPCVLVSARGARPFLPLPFASASLPFRAVLARVHADGWEHRDRRGGPPYSLGSCSRARTPSRLCTKTD